MNHKARSRKFTSKQSARLGAYFAAGVAASMAASSEADAAIVFFDVNPDFNTGNFGGFTAGDINLANGTYTLGSSGGYFFSLYAINNGIYWGGNIFQAEGSLGFTTAAVPFAYGAPIDDALTWGAGSISYAGGTSPWVSGANTYVALRLDQGDGIFNYGWVNLTFTADEGALVTGFAFEGQANTAINAGDQGGGPGPEPIPEPGTWATAALLMGGATYLGWRRRRDAAQKVAA